MSSVVGLLAPIWVGSPSLGCGGQTAAYPEVALGVSDVRVEVDDARSEYLTEHGTRPPLYRDERETLPIGFPTAAFAAGARHRLAPLISGGGPLLTLQTSVRRNDVTYYNDHRGDFVRWDVELRFTVEDEAGAVVSRGAGAAWREIPIEEASEPEKQRVLLQTALEAFDRYFADRAVLERLAEAARASSSARARQ